MTLNASSLSSIQRILAAPWQQRRHQGSLRAWWLILGLALLAPIGSAILFHDRPRMSHAVAFLVVVELWMFIAGAWAFVVLNVAEQNTPTAARLVPMHAGDLRRALRLGWVVGVACATAVGTLLHLALLSAVIAALAGAAIVVAVRWRPAFFCLCVAPSAYSLSAVSGRPQALLSELMATWLGAPVPIALAALAVSAVVVGTAIRQGDPRHVRAYAASSRRRLLVRRKSGIEAMASSHGFLGRLSHAYAVPYDRWMARLLARRNSSPMSRAMLALGPTAHWTTFLATLATMLAMASVALVGVMLYCWANDSPARVGDIASGWMIGGLAAFVSPVLQLPGRLRRAQREQALVALLPGVQRGAALGRALSLRLTAQFLMGWTASAVLIVSVIGPGLWWGPRGSQDGFAEMISMILLAIAVWFAQQHGLVSLPVAACLIVGASTAWCVTRWVRMGREPTAFPVGRLAP